MIAFGVMVAEPEAYHRYTEPGIRLAAEPDSRVLAFATTGSAARTCNLLLDAAAAIEDLEALILLHAHTEIADPDLCAKVRVALAEPAVAVAGCAGAQGVRTLAWWRARVSAGEITQRYNEHGGGEVRAYAWVHPAPPPATVDVVDELLMALSPWAVRNVRFDEGLPLGFGFDLDYCLEVGERGHQVVTFDASVIQHRSVELIERLELWVEGHIAFAQKWDARLAARNGAQGLPATGIAEDLVRARARRAEAEREAARAITYFRRLALDARVAEMRKQVDELTSSRSWRLTAPLRELNHWRRSRLVADPADE
ncbi:MAG: glycosyltransferase family 2 protein [Solirubrobacteraceae bacterium]